MRRMMLVLATVLLAAGCAREPAPAAVPVPSPVLSPSPVAEHRDADIYVQVLRRYLGTPAENSFAQNFPPSTSSTGPAGVPPSRRPTSSASRTS